MVENAFGLTPGDLWTRLPIFGDGILYKCQIIAATSKWSVLVRILELREGTNILIAEDLSSDPVELPFCGESKFNIVTKPTIDFKQIIC